MAKPVDLVINIDEDGNIEVKINGTEGTECLDVMSFLDKIESLIVEETISTDDMQTKEVQTVGKQSLNNK
ncbi:DUF2997 domain-containing protein [archaeon]|jgi:hypothetical protein|nr:DUF2997 domain-containing protein [archaeon]